MEKLIFIAALKNLSLQLLFMTILSLTAFATKPINQTQDIVEVFSFKFSPHSSNCSHHKTSQ